VHFSFCLSSLCYYYYCLPFVFFYFHFPYLFPFSSTFPFGSFRRFGSVTSFPYVWTRKNPTSREMLCVLVLSLFPVGAGITSFRSCVLTGPMNHVPSYAEITSVQGIGHLPLDRARVKNSSRHRSTPILRPTYLLNKAQDF
jgi:hypothetical protein